MLPLAAALLATACTGSPTPPGAPTASAAPTGSAGVPGVSGMPPTELSVAGITVVQSMGNDPLLPVAVRRPVAPGQGSMTDAIAAWANATESSFRADNAPSEQAPAELNVGWQVITASGPVLGIRMETFEFGGASGQTTHRVFYGDGSTTWTGMDLVTTAGRAEVAALVRSAVRASGHATLDPDEVGAAGVDALLTDLTFSAAGDLVLLLDQGTVAPFSAGNLTVTVPQATAEPLLSERGRRVADAVRSGLPYAVSVPTSAAPTPVAPATPVTPAPVPPATPAVAPPPAAAVDCTKLKCVALTFDDGPGSLTGTLLDRLEAAGVVATFFVLGQNVRIHPDLVTRMVRSGMVVGNHTWDHRDMKRLSLDEARSEVDRTSAEIARVTGVSTTLLRPPYGSMSPQTATLGQAIILWDVDTEDWKNRDASITTSRALATVRPGSIILMHDIHASTIEAVPAIIAGLKARGFTLVTVPVLLGNPQPGKVYTRR
ncbi:MAG TPA: polysaccharide deacetylase family protein [Dermatophilaceae bacterium]|nr:polysaccharide deacetylase family protein [Dermatophilaceae bacterium]HOA58495.1 polysaccharide deacetylase family protein [Dermatophilaceae bacterium]HPZ69644.1 polysaccharide deacetylase family protein [Dermatophilaceae bacterium]HQD01324.1 polysaccharide deacetylase family protein [Dermatophilaceae bacterium]